MAEKLTIFDAFIEIYKVEIEAPQKKQAFSLGQSNRHLLSARGVYLVDVQGYWSKLYIIQDDLEKALKFIRYIPYKKQLERMGLNPLDCLKYHTEVFSHKISTLLDVMRIMVNIVYEYNLTERQCTWENLKDLIQNPQVINILNGYFKTFKHLIIARNLNTHRAEYKDTGSEEIQTLYFLKKHRTAVESDEAWDFATNEYWLKYRAQKQIKERIQLFESYIKAAEFYVESLEQVLLLDAISLALKKDGFDNLA